MLPAVVDIWGSSPLHNWTKKKKRKEKKRVKHANEIPIRSTYGWTGRWTNQPSLTLKDAKSSLIFYLHVQKTYRYPLLRWRKRRTKSRKSQYNFSFFLTNFQSLFEVEYWVFLSWSFRCFYNYRLFTIVYPSKLRFDIMCSSEYVCFCVRERDREREGKFYFLPQFPGDIWPA